MYRKCKIQRWYKKGLKGTCDRLHEVINAYEYSLLLFTIKILLIWDALKE